MIVKHKFLDLYPLVGKKTLIIRTFNPDVPCNKAEFFYGRAKDFCEKNSIKFRFLPTPARFAANEKKRQEWRECFNQTVN
ncbi:MAG: hypothetical protein WC390_03465 [Sulfurimonas sp.]|jgi:hypothetical protein